MKEEQKFEKNKQRKRREREAVVAAVGAESNPRPSGL
jgi:hypothetical protein